jgi:hypothetical protein
LVARINIVARLLIGEEVEKKCKPPELRMRTPGLEDDRDPVPEEGG